MDALNLYPKMTVKTLRKSVLHVFFVNRGVRKEINVQCKQQGYGNT